MRTPNKKALVVAGPLSRADIERKLHTIRKRMFLNNARSMGQKDIRWKDFVKMGGEELMEYFQTAYIARVARIHQDGPATRVPRCHECWFWRKLGPKWGECVNERHVSETLAFDPYKVDPARLDELAQSSPRVRKYSFGCNFGVRKSEFKL